MSTFVYVKQINNLSIMKTHYYYSSNDSLDFFIFRDELNKMGISDSTIKTKMKMLGITPDNLVGGYHKSNGGYFPKTYALWSSSSDTQYYVENGIRKSKEVYSFTYNTPEKTGEAMVLLKFIIFNEIIGLSEFSPKFYDTKNVYIKLQGPKFEFSIYLDLKSMLNKDPLIIDSIIAGFKNQYDCTKDKTKVHTIEKMSKTFFKSDFYNFLISYLSPKKGDE
jgi:hypothetical protein